MRLNEITKDEFATKLKDPLMAKAESGLKKFLSRMSGWVVIQEPTYDDPYNDAGVKIDPDEEDSLVMMVSRTYPLDMDSNDIAVDVDEALNLVDSIFNVGWDEDQDWDRKGREIHTIRIALDN